MTLGKKILIVFGATLVVAVGATYAIANYMVLGSFEQLERKYVTTNVTRVQNAIEDDVDALKGTCGDWAGWDDTRDFILGKKESYIKDNLQDAACTTLKAHFMLFFDRAQAVVHAKCFDFEKNAEVPFSDELKRTLLAHAALFRHAEPKDFKAGIVVHEGVPIALAAGPITSNGYKGETVGTFIIGRRLDAAAVAAFAERTKLTLTILPAASSTLPGDFAAARDLLTADSPIFVSVRDENSIAGYGELPDIAGRRCLLLRVDMPRDIYEHGARSAGYFMAALLVTGALLAAAILFALHAIVLRPLAHVSSHFQHVGVRDDLTARIASGRSDEIGVLANEFDKMVAKLAHARRKLTEQSYNAGMSEMASGILHNVRNSLTPVTAEIGNLCHKIKSAPLAQIAQARKELAGGAAAPDRRQALGKFLDLANQSMESLIRELAQGLERIESPVTQIEHILTHQEQYSHAEQLLETFEPAALLSDAVALVPEKLREGVAFDIDEGIGRIGAVKAPRLVLLQIFTNLLINAAEAIKEAKNAAGKIAVRIVREQLDGKDALHAEVSDNGCGIDAPTLPKLFERGFSTKGTGHSGVGLHWCANTLNAGKGSIQAESAGAGKGACFHVMFPVHAVETVGADNTRK